MTRGVPLKPPGVYARQCKALLCPRTKDSNTTHTRFKLSTVGFRAISGSPPIPPVRMEGETGGKTKAGEQMLSYSTKRNYWYQVGAGIPSTGEAFLPFGRKNRPMEKMSAAFPAASSTSLIPRNV